MQQPSRHKGKKYKPKSKKKSSTSNSPEASSDNNLEVMKKSQARPEPKSLNPAPKVDTQQAKKTEEKKAVKSYIQKQSLWTMTLNMQHDGSGYLFFKGKSMFGQQSIVLLEMTAKKGKIHRTTDARPHALRELHARFDKEISNYTTCTNVTFQEYEKIVSTLVNADTIDCTEFVKTASKAIKQHIGFSPLVRNRAAEEVRKAPHEAALSESGRANFVTEKENFEHQFGTLVHDEGQHRVTWVNRIEDPSNKPEKSWASTLTFGLAR